MHKHFRCLKFLITVSGAATAFGFWAAPLAAADWPAYLENIPGRRPVLLVFPTSGSAVRLPLPIDLPKDFRLIEYSSDGKTIYGQKLNSWDGITKIEFRPLRQGLIPGSAGFGTTASIVRDQASDKLLIAGLFKRQNTVECGIFELDPEARNVRRIFKGELPACGAAISPNGRRAARSTGNRLSIVDLDTGIVHPIGEGLRAPAWSPNGRWIAAIRGSSNARSVVLIDTGNMQRWRSLGRTNDSQAQWSPDSKCLLIAKPETLRCGPDLWSLEMVDVETGTRRDVRSARCRIFQNSAGWLDPKAVR
jgi:Tol biopolymer transport system component